MKTPYFNMGLATLMDQGYTAKLENKITIYDNFNQFVDINNEVSQTFRDMPIKMDGVTIFMFCLEGTIDVQLSFKDYTLQKNDIFIVQSGQLGQYHSMSGDVKFFNIFVHNNFCNPLTNINSSVKIQDILFRGPYHHCTDEEMDEMLHIYRFIHSKIDGEYMYKDDVIRGYVYALLYNIYSLSYAESKVAEDQPEEGAADAGNIMNTSRQMQIYNEFIEEVQKHYMQEHKIGFYADKLCITPKYLSQVVYKVSGRFAKDYIRDCLILEAKVQLKSGATIQDICDRMNFNSPTFFSRYFKENTGFTPMEYQNKKR